MPNERDALADRFVCAGCVYDEIVSARINGQGVGEEFPVSEDDDEGILYFEQEGESLEQSILEWRVEDRLFYGRLRYSPGVFHSPTIDELVEWTPSSSEDGAHLELDRSTIEVNEMYATIGRYRELKVNIDSLTDNRVTEVRS